MRAPCFLLQAKDARVTTKKQIAPDEGEKQLVRSSKCLGEEPVPIIHSAASRCVTQRCRTSSWVELSIDHALKRLRKLCPRRGGALDGDTFA
jgi:hypothetical protein